MVPTPDATADRVELPPAFAAHVATVSGLETPPDTLEEWWTAVAEEFSASGETITLADLYSDTPTRHEVHVDGRVRYAHCALDALAAAVLEAQETVSVRSVDPVSRVPITFTVGEDELEVSHADALLCYGSTADAATVAGAGSLAEWALQEDKSEVRAAVCQYTNAFESAATYEQYAADTESVTAPIPPDRAVELLQHLTAAHGRTRDAA